MIYFLIFITQFVLLFFLSKMLTRSVSLLIYKITRSQNVALKIFHFLFLPGILIHELSHLIISEVMLVRTSGLNLKLEKMGDEVRMGSVQIQKTDSVRRAIIGFAPVLVGFIIISITIYFFLSENSPFSIFLSYTIVFLVVFEIGNTMFSSKKDLEGTIELLIFIFLVLIVAYVLGFNFPDIESFLNQANTQELLLRGMKILSIPIFINGVIIVIAKLLTNRH